MARILIAWELGDGLGHLGSFPLLSQYLLGRGHQVTLAVRDLASAEPVLGHLGGGIGGARLVQAPIWLGDPGKLPLAASYAEVLQRVGHTDPQALTGLVRGWRGLFDSVAPQVAMFNHSPTALLAARGLGFPRVVQGTGFTCPATAGPRPVFPLWAPVDPARTLPLEARLLGTMNHALEWVGARPLDALADLFSVEGVFLNTLGELDPYRGLRRAPEYLGPVPSQTRGVSAEFPAGPGPRVLAYLKRSYGHLAPMLDGLRRSGAAVLAYVAGFTQAEAQDWSSGRMRVSERPFDTGPLLPEADLVVHHGGHGTCADALLAGVPMLVLPLHVENWVNGQAVAGCGAGLVAGWGQGLDAPAGLRQALGDGGLRARAQSVKAEYAGLDRAARILAMGQRLEGLVV